MGENTGIAWTDHTFNIAWGCTKISKGCANCYALSATQRFGHGGVWGRMAPRRTFGDKHWNDPLRWQRKILQDGPRSASAFANKVGVELVFCSSMCDVFEDHPTITQERAKLWELIRQTPQLHWQLLTKRADRIADCLPGDWGNGWPNVWLGVSVEDQGYTWRISYLRGVPATVRFVSYEPAIGPLVSVNLEGIDWLVYGGESGPRRRWENLSWADHAWTLCRSVGATFFYKQGAALRPGTVSRWAEKFPREFPVTRDVCRNQ